MYKQEENPQTNKTSQANIKDDDEEFFHGFVDGRKKRITERIKLKQKIRFYFLPLLNSSVFGSSDFFLSLFHVRHTD